MIQAFKFKDWNIPRTGRLDPFRLPLKSSLVSPFRLDGAISLYGRQRKPTNEKTHTTSFVLKKGCEADLQIAIDRMMETLLSGAGRLWFDTPSHRGPQVFYENVQPNSIDYTPNRDDWSMAQIDIEWEIEIPILYRPLGSGFLASEGYTPVTIGASTFGESWEERTFASFPISASPTAIVVNNPGQMRTHRVILRLESLGVNGAVNPQIENTTTDQRFKYNGTLATSSAILQANAAIGSGRVRTSTDSGASFVDTPNANLVWSNCEINDDQGPIMELDPGINNIQVTADGTPNFRLLIEWQPAYGMI